jgi:hypothetical protein
MKRRRFLGVAAVATVGGIGLLLLDSVRLKERLLSTSVGKRARESILGVESSEGISELMEAEEAGLLKLAGAVLPSDSGDVARAVVLDHLRWRARTGPGYAHEFRRALSLLDDETERRYGVRSDFAHLSGPEAAVVVGALLEGIVAYQLSAASRSDVLRLAISPRFLRRYRMRRHVVNEIIDGYYRSSLAWRRLGYRSFPGACAGMIYSQPPIAASDSVAK